MARHGEARRGKASHNMKKTPNERPAAEVRRVALGAAAPPEGFAPTHVTTDAEGGVVSVRSEPEGKHKLHDPVPDGHHVKGLTTLLNGAGEVKNQYVKTDTSKALQEARTFEAIRLAMSEYRAAGTSLAPAAPLCEAGRDCQASILLGDPHVGMLSWHVETGADFDLTIAQQYMRAAVDLLIERTPPAESCRVVNLGDFFHANDQKGMTPHGGNRLDVDSRHAKVTRVGVLMLRRIIEAARRKFPRVEVVSLQGNHDPDAAFTLQLLLEQVYEGDPCIEVVPNESPYIFREFGNNLTMYHHGDGAKPEACPGVMASYQDGVPWGRCPYREIQGGHVHHLTRKEFPGVVFETSRTTAPADFWHHWKGYRAGRGMRSLVHHREFGRLSEHTVGAREIELRVKALAA